MCLCVCVCVRVCVCARGRGLLLIRVEDFVLKLRYFESCWTGSFSQQQTLWFILTLLHIYFLAFIILHKYQAFHSNVNQRTVGGRIFLAHDCAHNIRALYVQKSSL